MVIPERLSRNDSDKTVGDSNKPVGDNHRIAYDPEFESIWNQIDERKLAIKIENSKFW